MPFDPGAEGSVFAAVITRSACWPLVMKVLAPLIFQPSPSGCALARIDCRSEPAPGSVIAMAPTQSPLTMFGR